MIDILYVAHNRLEYSVASFENLLVNTDWDLVGHLYVLDDQSTDGTFEFLERAVDRAPVDATLMQRAFGGPVNAMNWMLDRTNAEIFAKVDNDLILPPGWLGMMLAVMIDNPSLDALGTEPGFAAPVAPNTVWRGFKDCPHIGGQGLFRASAFSRRRPQGHDRYFGLTEFQRRRMQTGWIDPDIASFNLDHLPFEPWRSLAGEYGEQGWSRAWSSYDPAMSDYWTWWTTETVKVA